MGDSEVAQIWIKLADFRRRGHPLLLGITGGIASGKTTVANMFAQFGIPIIDFDQLSRIVVEPDKPAWKEIAAYFGKEVLLPDKNIDRKKLAQIVFQDEAKRKKLESFIHPQIFREFVKRLKNLSAAGISKIVLAVVPLLLEANLQHFFHKIILVYIPFELQIARLMKRDQISREMAMKMLAAQWPIEEKKAYADFLIDNSGSLLDTEKQVKEVWQLLQKLI